MLEVGRGVNLLLINGRKKESVCNFLYGWLKINPKTKQNKAQTQQQKYNKENQPTKPQTQNCEF